MWYEHCIYFFIVVLRRRNKLSSFRPMKQEGWISTLRRESKGLIWVKNEHKMCAMRLQDYVTRHHCLYIVWFVFQAMRLLVIKKRGDLIKLLRIIRVSNLVMRTRQRCIASDKWTTFFSFVVLLLCLRPYSLDYKKESVCFVERYIDIYFLLY